MKTLQEIIMEKVKEQSAFPFYSKNSKNYKSNMAGVGDEFYLSNSIKIVKKSGTQQVEIVKGGHIGVGNKEGFLSNWITVYRDGKWASDGTFKLNKGIIDFLDKNASKVKKMADEIKYAKNSVEESKKTYVANIEHTRTGEKRSVKFTTSRSPKVEASKLLKALEWVKSIDTVSEDVSVVEGAKPNYFYVSHNIQLATLPGKVLVETPKAQKSFPDFGTAMTWIQGLDGDYNTKEIHNSYHNRSTPEKEPKLYESSKEGDYMLLSRLQMDCKYVIDNADKATSKKGLEKHLWAGNVKDQIAKMKELYNSFSKEEKPEWISMEDINSYEKKLNSIFSSLKEAKLELWDEVNLATHWLSALVNGDSSGLSDEEEEKLDKWESKLPKGYTIDYGDLEDTDFKIDVVSGLRATTVRVKIYAQGK
jgi:hypothetical protein